MSMHNDVRTILTSGQGKLIGGNTFGIREGSSLFKADGPNRIDSVCWDATTTVNTASREILVRPVAVGSTGVNSVMIGNASEWGAVGQLASPNVPGFLFSDCFSGCLFYLFRDDNGSVYGCHSFRQSGTSVDPIPFFNRRSAKLLYFFNTGGAFTSGAYPTGTFGAVLAYVNRTDIFVHFCAYDPMTRRVLGVVDYQRIANWKSAAAITAPNVAGAQFPHQPWLSPKLPSTKPPKAAGLKQRVAKFALNYI